MGNGIVGLIGRCVKEEECEHKRCSHNHPGVCKFKTPASCYQLCFNNDAINEYIRGDKGKGEDSGVQGG